MCVYALMVRLGVLGEVILARTAEIRGVGRRYYFKNNTRVNKYLYLTAYHFWGAVSHLKTLRRGSSRCSLTKRVVGFHRFVTYSQ